MAQDIADAFAKFVEAKLAKRGFKVVTPWLAERRTNGVRQGIMWTAPQDGDGLFAMTKVRTFRSFDHELDDGPHGRVTPPQGTDPVCAQMSGELGLTGDCTRKSFIATLALMASIELDSLDEAGSAERILLTLQTEPSKASYLLGRDERVARYNFAHCHERTGQVKRAVELYREFAQSVEGDESQLARNYSRVALHRAEMLDLLDAFYTEFKQAEDPTSLALASRLEVLYRPAA